MSQDQHEPLRREVTDSPNGYVNTDRMRAAVRDLFVDYDKLRAELEQTRVQLAGCGVAALGGTSPEQRVIPGQYGWSASYGDVLRTRLRLEAANDELREARACLAIERGRRIVANMVGELQQSVATNDDEFEDLRRVFDHLDAHLVELAETRQSRMDDRRERGRFLLNASIEQVANNGLPVRHGTLVVENMGVTFECRPVVEVPPTGPATPPDESR